MRRTVGDYRTRAAVGLAVAIATAAGCSHDSNARLHESPPVPAPSAAPAVPSSSTVDYSDAAGCFDGECEIEVSAPVEMPMHPRSRIAVLRIEVVEPYSVRVQATYRGGGYGEAIVSGAGIATLNNLSVRVVEVTDGTARLELSPA